MAGLVQQGRQSNEPYLSATAKGPQTGPLFDSLGDDTGRVADNNDDAHDGKHKPERLEP